jgi:ligand-binding SRPBCC domain-containing protein
MHFTIKTPVDQTYKDVFRQFDKDLILKLTPPWVRLKVLRFDGSQKGCEVHLELSFLGWKQKWISRITEFYEGKDEIFFIDEGIQLPWFLKSWRHNHRIIRHETGSIIIDDVTYECSFPFLNYFFFPMLCLQFYWRKPIYREFFQ